jgi:hypothetical protein
MRNLELGVIILSLLPCAVACTSDKAAPDIGYGACDGVGTIDAATGTGNTGNTGNRGSVGSGSGGRASSSGGTQALGDGGGDDMPGFDACSRAWSAPPAETDCDLDNLPDSGVTLGTVSGNYRTISADTTLESNKTYKVDGLTIVEPGVTLTIKKCTKILGQSNSSVLVTDSGIQDLGDGNWSAQPAGRIVAIGEADAPIVMTSAKPPGQRKPGDWGGLVLAGKAPENVWRNTYMGHELSLPSVAEGILERDLVFGWRTDEYADEDSGTLKYVRVEYVGHDLGNNSETNGITFNAVGRGTTISHVMVSNAIDDCFEWFGGTVNADHLIAFNCDDDGFDTDLGFSGVVQFGFSRQYPTTAETDSNGFEMDGNRSNTPAKPWTTNKFSNVVMCGGNTGKFQLQPRYGAVLRVGARPTLLNVLLTGFDSAALAIRDPPDTQPTITDMTAFGNFSLFDSADMKTLVWSSDPAAWFASQIGNSTDPPPGFCDCWANPPQPFATDKIPGVAPGDEFPDPGADYRGAFKDSTPESNWMAGRWVDWSEE